MQKIQDRIANEKHPSYRITNKDDREAKLHPLDKTGTQAGEIFFLGNGEFEYLSALMRKSLGTRLP